MFILHYLSNHLGCENNVWNCYNYTFHIIQHLSWVEVCVCRHSEMHSLSIFLFQRESAISAFRKTLTKNCILFLNSELLNKTHSFCGFVLSASRGASKCSIYTFSALALLIVFNALEQPCYTCSVQGQASSTFVLKELWDVLIHNPVYTSCEQEIYVMYAAQQRVYVLFGLNLAAYHPQQFPAWYSSYCLSNKASML